MCACRSASSISTISSAICARHSTRPPTRRRLLSRFRSETRREQGALVHPARLILFAIVAPPLGCDDNLRVAGHQVGECADRTGAGVLEGDAAAVVEADDDVAP